MTFSLYTQDSWGQLPVGEFASLEEARQAFGRHREGDRAGAGHPQGERQRLDWFGF
jgi:hypothetical protein